MIPNVHTLEEWNTWAKSAVVHPVLSGVKTAISSPFTAHLGNVKIARAAALINNPHAALSRHIKEHVPVDTLRFYRLVMMIRKSGANGIIDLLENYLERLDSIELAVESLLGQRLPVLDAISRDLRTLLGQRAPDGEFPAALLALAGGVTGAFERILGDLQIVAARKGTSPTTLDIAPGHFYDWVCCTTDVDKRIQSDEERKQQQRLRQTMMKVILAYIDEADISASRFKASAESGGPATTFGGFPVTSSNATAMPGSATGFVRAYAGLVAAAFEHVFVSGRPLTSQSSADPADAYHELPLTLKLQRPDLARVAFPGSGSSPFAGLGLNSEFLAMRVASTSATLTSGIVRTGINCLGNGVWQISPNNPPLVDTIAQLVAIPVYELEKALLYDVLRRFRVYVTDQPLDTSHECVLMHASMNVPDFSSSPGTERQLTAAVVCSDKTLLSAAGKVLGDVPLPISLDDKHQIDETNELARLLYGTMKDSLAACYVLNS